ncbi:MAG: GGDEF domain-containing protein [Gammaproteobacteria bacterium]|nr:GGDEF domain-containing protein [Gammaproteobacteria bacterium]
MSLIYKPSILAQTNKLFYLALITLMVVLLFVLFYFSHYSESNTKRTAQDSLKVITLGVEEKLQFYQHLVDGMAMQPEVRWLLFDRKGSAEAEAWALKQRSIIPDSIGLALTDEDANVLGNHGELRVGQACRADMQRNFHSSTYQIGIHDEIKHLAHFDILSPIKDDDGEQMGLVFASFSIDVLRNTLEKLSGTESNIYLFEKGQEPSIDITRITNGELFSVEQDIANSKWRLRLQMTPPPLDTIIKVLVIFTILIAIIFVSVLVIYSRGMVSKFLAEFDNIHHVLKAVLKHDEELVPRMTRYRETESIISDIYSLSGAINYRQKYFSRQLLIDPLTGLGNRRSLDESIQKASSADENNNYLIYLDLDHFKLCNDNYGHDTGDEVLKALAICLSRHTEPDDVLIRLGGDEFVVILADIKPEQIERWYQRLSKCFSERQAKLKIEEQLCTISAGALLLDSTQGDSEAQKRSADKALYKAKHAGRNCLHICG